MNTHFDDPEDLMKPSAPCAELIRLLKMIDCARRVYERKGATKQADELRAFFNGSLRDFRPVANSTSGLVPEDVLREYSKVDGGKVAT